MAASGPAGRACGLAVWGAVVAIVWVVYARWLMARVGGTPLDFALPAALGALLQGFVLTRLAPTRQLIVACVVAALTLYANRYPALERHNPPWLGMLALAAVIANVFGRHRAWWQRALVAGVALDLGLVVLVLGSRAAGAPGATHFDESFVRVLVALFPLGLAVTSPQSPFPAHTESAE